MSSLPDLEARILYRDGLILILDKPAGIPVHAGPGGGINLEAGFDQLRFGLPHPPALAHRLDRDTAGCLVLGRHRKALSRVGKLFQAGSVAKTYWAIVRGAPPAPSGTIEARLSKHSDRTGWRMVVDPEHGQIARTDWIVRGATDRLTWLELTPHTGRTHQIRIHCAELDCPLVGEPIYATPPDRAVPLHLLARSINLPLYANREPVGAVAEPPDHMRSALSLCGWQSTTQTFAKS